MPTEKLKFEHVTCSRCGRKLSSLKECVGIRANINIPLCNVCYQYMLSPDIKVYDTEMFDYGSHPSEI